MRSSVRSILALGGALAALCAAPGAQANVYSFTQDGCSGSGSGGCGASPSTPVGSVTTELESPGVIGVTVTLTSGAFHDSSDPQHHALVFNLAGDPSITISDLLAPFTANGAQSAGSHGAAPFGSFSYVINFRHASHPPVETSFSFDISAPGLTLNSFEANKGVYFVSDIWAKANQTGHTGNVGAVSGVPEPATWAMLTLGFAGLGFLGYRKTKGAAIFAA